MIVDAKGLDSTDCRRRLTAYRAYNGIMPVPPLMPQRDHFTTPERHSTAWTLTKRGTTATCEASTHAFGFELRALVASELVQSEVCRTSEDLWRVQADWRAAFEAKGWTR